MPTLTARNCVEHSELSRAISEMRGTNKLSSVKQVVLEYRLLFLLSATGHFGDNGCERIIDKILSRLIEICVKFHNHIEPGRINY